MSFDPFAVFSEMEIPNAEALAGRAAAQRRQTQEAAQDLNLAVARMLATGDGQKFLTWLMGITVLRPTYDHTMPYDRITAHGLFREGQNSIAFAIAEMSRRAQTPNLPPNSKG
jgi:hypothetical protein